MAAVQVFMCIDVCQGLGTGSLHSAAGSLRRALRTSAQWPLTHELLRNQQNSLRARKWWIYTIKFDGQTLVVKEHCSTCHPCKFSHVIKPVNVMPVLLIITN